MHVVMTLCGMAVMVVPTVFWCLVSGGWGDRRMGRRRDEDEIAEHKWLLSSFPHRVVGPSHDLTISRHRIIRVLQLRLRIRSHWSASGAYGWCG